MTEAPSRLIEIENYYGVDDVNNLDIWERQFNIPPREMVPVVFERNGKRYLTAGLWSFASTFGKMSRFRERGLNLQCQNRSAT